MSRLLYRLCLLPFLCFIGACAALPPCAPVVPDRPANAGCFVVAGERLLVVRDRMSGRLSFPGGTSEPPEPAQCTAARETREETGLAVQVGPLLERLAGNFHLYRCQPVAGQSLPVQPPWSARVEIEMLDWVDPWLIPAEDWRFPYQLERVRRLFDVELRTGDQEGPAACPQTGNAASVAGSSWCAQTE